MQPSTQTKPVMDVAAPKSPAPAFNPFAQRTAAPTAAPKSAGELPVRPAPFSPAPSQPVDAPAHRPATTKRPANTASATPRKPVALITVTVFVMLVLSVLAVTVYVTSQTA